MDVEKFIKARLQEIGPCLESPKGGWYKCCNCGVKEELQNILSKLNGGGV